MGIFDELKKLTQPYEDEDEDAFDVDAFFNEMNPTINDAGFGNGFVPDEDNM